MRWSPEGDVDLCASDPVEAVQEPTTDDIGAALVRDLRSPLTTIEQYLDLLADGAVGALTVEQLEYLDVARRNVQRLSTVVTDWVDVTRVEADQIQLAHDPVDLVAIVAHVAAQHRPDIQAKEHTLTVNTPTEPVLVYGDERALRRVVSNLLSNAHKYTPPGGSIQIAVTAESDGRVRLDVADSGIGLGEEDQQHLFYKFFRARLTEAIPGTGLGLALTKALVDRMGGQISLSSALGKGSTFSVSLPQARHGVSASARRSGSESATAEQAPASAGTA